MKAGSQPTATNFRWLLVLILVVCSVVTLSACGGDDQAATGSGGDADVGGTLTIANPGFPSTLDPAMGVNEFSDYYNLVYDPLIMKAPDGSFEPGLALSWEYGPRNLSFSMELRPGVQFSDGTKLDAEAVKTWINHVATLPGGSGGQYLANLESIEVTGPLSLTLHFSKPTPLLEQALSQYLQIGDVGSPKSVKAGTLDTEPVGTGPYLLDKSSTVARSQYTFVPNPTYWNKEGAHWQKVVIKTIANPNAALQALKTDQVQVVKDQPVSTLDAAKSAGMEYVAPSTLIMALELSDREGKMLKPLGDVRVRQAINYAIDREAVSNVVGAGYGEITDQFAAEGDDAYDPALAERYPYDPEKAKELLAEAGYEEGFTLPVLSLNIVEQDTLTQAVAGQLAKVGIEVQPDITSNLEEYATAFGGAEYPATTISWGRLPAVTQYQLLWGPEAAEGNSFGVKNPELTKAYNELSAADPDEAGPLARRMQEILVEQAWFAPVVVTPLVVLHSPEVAGVNATTDRNVTDAQEFRPAG